MLHWSAAEHYSIVRLFSYFMPWFLALLIPATFLSLKFRHYVLFVCFLMSIGYIVACYGFHFLPKHSETAATGEQIKVISLNVWSKNTDMDAITRIFEPEMPDLLFLQEISQKQLNQLVNHLRSSRNKRLVNVCFDQDRLLATLSHFPLVAMHPPGTTRTRIQKVRVTSNHGAFMAFNVHFVRGSRQKNKMAIEKFIKEQLTNSPEPILLGGDLNTTEQSSIYQSLKVVLNNSHDEVGRGFGFTYPANLPLPAMVRIDHIFYSSHFSANTARTLSLAGGSDHFPVLATLVFLPP